MKWFNLSSIILLIGAMIEFIGGVKRDVTNAHLSLPNRNTGKSFERILGLGVVLPYPYYQKPKYRYPVYDSKGKGQLLYGYGGDETYEYREFTPIEGHH